MGKKYYCDYCDKTFRNDPSIKKKHIDGLPHQKARNAHYAQFKTAQEIVKEEQRKKPCGKFPNGTCPFGVTCRFSHYTSEQLAQIKERAEHEKQQQIANLQPKVYSKSMIHDFMKKRKLVQEQNEQRFLRELFHYPNELFRYECELPPSIRPIDVETLKKDFKPTFYG